jgi:hypothetical protein
MPKCSWVRPLHAAFLPVRDFRAVAAAMMLLAASAGLAQPPADANAVIEHAAEALGGADAILAVGTLELRGYGTEAYFWGGGNITGDPDAMQKWAENPDLQTVWDFTNRRFRTQYRHNFLFPFGGTFGHSFGLSVFGLDGDVAYVITADAPARRLARWTTRGQWFQPDGQVFRRYESLTHPFAAVRAVLSGEARAENRRTEQGFDLIDIVVDEGALTMAVDPASGLPRWIRWPMPHQNLGRVVATTTFIGYERWDGGLQLPMGWRTHIDWRDTLIVTRFVDGYFIDGEHAPDIAAAPDVLDAPLPPDRPTTQPVQAMEVAQGIWHLTGGHTVIEFDDHLVIFELGGTAEQTRAVLDFANGIIPEKRVTHLIVSHHHFDHTAGFRAAVEAGLIVISDAGNEAFLREVAARPSGEFTNLVPLAEGGSFEFVPFEGRLRLQDAAMTLDIYEVVRNNHMADAVFAYAPASRTLIEADLATPANEFSFWAEAYEDNIEHYALDVDRVSPNHALPMTHEETLEWIRLGVPRALARCEAFAEAGRPLPGCPAFIFRDWEKRFAPQ